MTGLGVGGAETALLRLLSRMDRERFESSVVSLVPPGPMADRIEELGIGVSSLGMPAGRATLSGLLRCISLLRAARPDVLQTWMYHADLLGAVAGPVARVPRLIWNIRGSTNQHTQRARALRLVVRGGAALSRVPDVIVANSHAGRSTHIGAGYRREGWQVIPNGIDTEEFRPDAGSRAAVRRELCIPEHASVIGLVARFDPLKAHESFLRAAARLSERWPDAHFVLVGEGVTPANPAIAAVIGELDLAPRVRLLGRRADVARLTRAFDIATSCSLSEGFPNVLIEAMASGVPCVATDVGDSARIVGETGIIVPPADPPALAAGWDTLLGSGASHRARRGLAARERAVEHYGLDAVSATYESLYRRVTRARRSPGADYRDSDEVRSTNPGS